LLARCWVSLALDSIYQEGVDAVYVLGQVQVDRSVGEPAHGSASTVFVVSNSSKEARSKSLGRWITGLLWLGIVLAAAALGLIGWGLHG